MLIHVELYRTTDGRELAQLVQPGHNDGEKYVERQVIGSLAGEKIKIADKRIGPPVEIGMSGDPEDSPAGEPGRGGASPPPPDSSDSSSSSSSPASDSPPGSETCSGSSSKGVSSTSGESGQGSEPSEPSSRPGAGSPGEPMGDGKPRTPAKKTKAGRRS